jgi:hypothetical protein
MQIQCYVLGPSLQVLESQVGPIKPGRPSISTNHSQTRTVPLIISPYCLDVLETSIDSLSQSVIFHALIIS